MTAIHKFVVLNVAEKPSVAWQLTSELASGDFKVYVFRAFFNEKILTIIICET
jgi:hypothetical protein